ncbi:hypothetical protein PMAYCL1PPCAC_30114, partial [Pristionchus mayeri]
PMGCSCACCTPKVKIVYGSIGAVFGITAGIFYAIVFHNVSASTIAIISAVFALLYVYMHWAYKKNLIRTWPDAKIKSIFWINLLIFIVASVGMIACLVIAGINHQGLTYDDLHGENLWMTSGWCFITAKWSGMNSFYARSYKLEAMKSPPPMIY